MGARAAGKAPVGQRCPAECSLEPGNVEGQMDGPGSALLQRYDAVQRDGPIRVYSALFVAPLCDFPFGTRSSADPLFAIRCVSRIRSALVATRRNPRPPRLQRSAHLLSCSAVSGNAPGQPDRQRSGIRLSSRDCFFCPPWAEARCVCARTHITEFSKPCHLKPSGSPLHCCAR